MSALRKQPNLNKQVQNYAGAFGYDPSSLLTKLQQQQQNLQSKIDKKTAAGKTPNKLMNKLQNVQNNIGQVQNSSPYQMQQMNNQANAGISQQMGYIQQQGQFNPQNLPNLNQDYSQMRKQAEDNVMSAFNRQMQPEFQRQSEDFRQTMANQGVPEGSEKWNLLYKQMQDSQSNARQNAMNQAFTTGQSEQAQGFNQAFNANQLGYNQQYQTYQMPYQNMQAFQPYYAGQMNLYGQQLQNQYQQQQNKWQAGQNALDRQVAGKIGGGRPYDPNAGMNGFYDQMIGGLYGNQQKQPGTGTALGQGLVSGVSQGIANSILR